MSTSPSRTLPLLAPPPGAPIDEAPAGRPEISIPEPPVARVVPRSNSIHGETRVDEYAWLRNREDPEVLRDRGSRHFPEAVCDLARGKLAAPDEADDLPAVWLGDGAKRGVHLAPYGKRGWGVPVSA